MIMFVDDDEPISFHVEDGLNESLQSVAEEKVEEQGSNSKKRKKTKSNKGKASKKHNVNNGTASSTSRQPTLIEKINELTPEVHSLAREQLDTFAITALRLHPTLMVQLKAAGSTSSGSQSPSMAQQDSPKWCHCGRCREMPLPEEQLCCRRTDGFCTTVLAENIFNTVVLNLDVLQVAIQNRNDMLVYNVEPNNQELRNTAYRQYVLWKLGRLGAGKRVVIPSCVVWRVRDTFPSPNNIYVGFKPSRLT